MDLFARFDTLAAWLNLGLSVVLIGVKVFCFTDALRYSAAHYPAAGKKSRNLWLVILGLALAVALILFYNALNFINLAGTVAALVYLFDVRPALQQVRGTGGGRPGQMGPYGPW